MSVYVLTVRANVPEDYLTWIFDYETEFKRAVKFAQAYPDEFDILYMTDNAGKPDFVSDAGEFKRWRDGVRRDTRA